ncbi:MAG: SDR family oxidoreductase [Bryobacteraceae bacterium]|nr:SDR family oxidoreductase [Bryobacterales bacterium]MEB2363078.1 SDR family oxidoreductase [Bryobacterales bacterium]NUM99900.1 SDR family oxidoreductase [Bryobacteraceae bacterium]
MRLEGKIVLITGAARGIGWATADLFGAEGARVIGTDLDDGTDVTQPRDVAALFEDVQKRFGRLDILVCNAGRPYNLTSLSASEDEWEACLAANLKSVWLCARAAYPLLSRSDAGAVVTIASMHGIKASRNGFPYSVAKGGLLALTRTLAVEWAPNIRVNAVIPGQIESVRTEPFFQSFRDPDETRRRVLSTYPMRRLGKPADVAKAALFLASDDAAWITGTYLIVDGGRDAALPDLSDLKD